MLTVAKTVELTMLDNWPTDTKEGTLNGCTSSTNQVTSAVPAQHRLSGSEWFIDQVLNFLNCPQTQISTNMFDIYNLRSV